MESNERNLQKFESASFAIIGALTDLARITLKDDARVLAFMAMLKRAKSSALRFAQTPREAVEHMIGMSLEYSHLTDVEKERKCAWQHHMKKEINLIAGAENIDMGGES